MIAVEQMTGQDLAYWIARANAPHDANIVRRHYDGETPRHEPIDEPSMRRFVAEKFGAEVSERKQWQ